MEDFEIKLTEQDQAIMNKVKRQVDLLEQLKELKKQLALVGICISDDFTEA